MLAGVGEAGVEAGVGMTRTTLAAEAALTTMQGVAQVPSPHFCASSPFGCLHLAVSQEQHCFEPAAALPFVQCSDVCGGVVLCCRHPSLCPHPGCACACCAQHVRLLCRCSDHDAGHSSFVALLLLLKVLGRSTDKHRNCMHCSACLELIAVWWYAGVPDRGLRVLHWLDGGRS